MDLVALREQQLGQVGAVLARDPGDERPLHADRLLQSVSSIFSHDNCRLLAMSRRARELLTGLAVVILFALPLLPEIVGSRRLIFRDALVTHWPWRRAAVEMLARGEVPFIDARASGGQPLLANPNAVLLYPTFLLERVVPAESAFNLHYLLHVLWAFFGARVLARRLGVPEGAAFLSGVAYAFSGTMLSFGSAFMNSSAAAAWLPWCAAAALDLARASGPGRTRLRAGAALAIALGLQLLAGEPAISLLTGIFAGCLAAGAAIAAHPGERARSLLRFGAALAVSGAAALALAAPLLLPLRQVLPLTFRGQHLYSKDAFGAVPLSPARLLEWLFPSLCGKPERRRDGAALARRGRAARLRLERHPRRRSPSGVRRGGSAPGVLEPPGRGPVRGGAGVPPALLRLPAPPLRAPLRDRAAAPPALPHQVLPDHEPVPGAAGGPRGGEPRPAAGGRARAGAVRGRLCRFRRGLGAVGSGRASSFTRCCRAWERRGPRSPRPFGAAFGRTPSPA